MVNGNAVYLAAQAYQADTEGRVPEAIALWEKTCQELRSGEMGPDEEAALLGYAQRVEVLKKHQQAQGAPPPPPASFVKGIDTGIEKLLPAMKTRVAKMTGGDREKLKVLVCTAGFTGMFGMMAGGSIGAMAMAADTLFNRPQKKEEHTVVDDIKGDAIWSAKLELLSFLFG